MDQTRICTQMDGQTDKALPIYPPNFVSGGYKNQNALPVKGKFLFHEWGIKHTEKNENSMSEQILTKPCIEDIFKTCIQ